MTLGGPRWSWLFLSLSWSSVVWSQEEPQAGRGRGADDRASIEDAEIGEGPGGPRVPRLSWAPSVPYPPGGQGSARVVLRILIEEDGTVHQPEVVNGEEPFASIASAWVTAFSFHPAEVAGAPHAAWALIALDFEPPGGGRPAADPPSLETFRVGSWEQTEPRPSSDAAVPSAPLEVSVTGIREAPTSRVVSDAETRIIPGAEGDPLRALDTVPGTVPVLASGPFLGLRGAAGGMVGYEYDGISVPYLFHLARGPAVVHPWLVDSATLHATGGPARLGRSGGGFFEATAAEPTGRLRASARLRATDAALGMELPLAGGKVDVLAAGRVSYTEGLVGLVAPDFSLDFWDYQARARLRLGKESSLEVLGFGAGDRSAQRRSDGSFEDLFHGSFHRVALRYRQDRRDGGRLRVTAHYGHDRWDGNATAFRPRAHLLGLRAEDSVPLTARTQVSYGADANVRFQTDQFEGPSTSPGLPAAVEQFRRTDLQAATWADVVTRPARDLTLSFGLRLDTMSSSETPVSEENGALAFQPRAALSYVLGRRLRWHQSIGASSQPRSPAQRPPGRVSSVAGGLEYSWLTDAGLEIRMPGDVLLDVTAFQNAYFEVGDVETLRFLQGQPPDLGRGQGTSRGMELSLRRTLSARLRGFVSYTLSQSIRSLGAVRTAFEYDRPHVLDVALAYDFGRGFGMSSRATLYSGYPARVQTAEQARAGTPRATAYYQIDVQGEKRFSLGSEGRYLAVTLGILNATLNQESNDFACSTTACREQLVGPATIPTIGIEGEL